MKINFFPTMHVNSSFREVNLMIIYSRLRHLSYSRIVLNLLSSNRCCAGLSYFIPKIHCSIKWPTNCWLLPSILVYVSLVAWGNKWPSLIIGHGFVFFENPVPPKTCLGNKYRISCFLHLCHSHSSLPFVCFGLGCTNAFPWRKFCWHQQ